MVNSAVKHGVSLICAYNKYALFTAKQSSKIWKQVPYMNYLKIYWYYYCGYKFKKVCKSTKWPEENNLYTPQYLWHLFPVLTALCPCTAL